MPGLSGIYTGERLKKANPRIKIFILTSYMDYLDEAMKFHVFRYLSKPVDEKRLFRNMKEALYQIEMETEPVPIETKDGIIVRQAEEIVYIEKTAVRRILLQWTKYMKPSIPCGIGMTCFKSGASSKPIAALSSICAM